MADDHRYKLTASFTTTHRHRSIMPRQNGMDLENRVPPDEQLPSFSAEPYPPEATITHHEAAGGAEKASAVPKLERRDAASLKRSSSGESKPLNRTLIPVADIDRRTRDRSTNESIVGRYVSLLNLPSRAILSANDARDGRESVAGRASSSSSSSARLHRQPDLPWTVRSERL